MPLTELSVALSFAQFVKGLVSQDFLLLVFFMNQFTPHPRVFHLDRFEFFPKIRGDIRESRCTTGINDTGGKFATGINRRHNCCRYQRHRRQICHRCQRRRRQIFPPISLVLLIPVANLPPVSTIPAANLPPVSTTPVANCHRYQRRRRQICHRCQ